MQSFQYIDFKKNKKKTKEKNKLVASSLDHILSLIALAMGINSLTNLVERHFCARLATTLEVFLVDRHPGRAIHFGIVPPWPSSNYALP